MVVLCCYAVAGAPEVPLCVKCNVTSEFYDERTIISGGLAMSVTKNNAANIDAARALSQAPTALSSRHITW